MTQEQVNKYLQCQQEETTVSLWGSKVTFKPYLLEKIFGDGMKLIYFGTIDDRPYWWLVRVDSNAKIDKPLEFDSEAIYEAIEEECGCWVPDDTAEVDGYGYDEDGTCHSGKYPMIISDSSEHWGLVADLKAGVDKYGIPLELGKESAERTRP